VKKKKKTSKQAKVQVIADATDPNMPTPITNYVNAILQTAQEKQPACIKYKPKLNCITIRNLKCFTFVPGVILMLVSAMMTSISITEKNWVLWKYSSPL
jgi:ABC-2 type transport system permease protein